jgi:hypothetical protein
MQIIRLDEKGQQIKPWLATESIVITKKETNVKVVERNKTVGFFERLFLRKHYSKIIDSWVESDKGTYRIGVTEEYDGLFSGKVRRNTYHMSCFPGGDDYAWYTKDLNEAKDKCIEVLWRATNELV